MKSDNLQRKHLELSRMSRHRIRIHNNALAERLYKRGMRGTHNMRRKDGMIWLYLDRVKGNYQLVKDVIAEYGIENGVEYELLMNPKGFHPNHNWVWVVPKYETFYREGDEKYEIEDISRKVGSQ